VASRRSRDRRSTFLARGSPPRHVAAFSTANPRSPGEAGFVAFSEALRVRVAFACNTREPGTMRGVPTRQSVNFYRASRTAVPRESVNCHWRRGEGRKEARIFPVSCMKSRATYSRIDHKFLPAALIALLVPHSHSRTEFATRDDSSICITGHNFFISLSLSLSLSLPAACALVRETSLGWTLCARARARVWSSRVSRVSVARSGD